MGADRSGSFRRVWSTGAAVSSSAKNLSTVSSTARTMLGDESFAGEGDPGGVVGGVSGLTGLLLFLLLLYILLLLPDSVFHSG